jgi:hypothetical protein
MRSYALRADMADLTGTRSRFTRYPPGGTHMYSTVPNGKGQSDVSCWVARPMDSLKERSKASVRSSGGRAIHTYIRVNAGREMLCNSRHRRGMCMYRRVTQREPVDLHSAERQQLAVTSRCKRPMCTHVRVNRSVGGGLTPRGMYAE